MVPLVLAIGALQLRHSFAAARGQRPCHWPWTLLALTVLVYLPMLWLSWRWYTTMWFVIGSAAMLLPAGWPPWSSPPSRGSRSSSTTHRGPGRGCTRPP